MAGENELGDNLPNNPPEPAPPAPAAPTEDDILNSSVRTIVDGEVKSVKVADLVAGAQKSRAADQRLQEASELLRDNKNKIAVAENLMKAKAGDQDALRAAVLGMGYDEESVDSMFNDLAGEQQSQQQPDMPLPAVLDMSDDDARALASFSQTMRQHNMSMQDVANVLAVGINKQGDMNRTEMVRQVVNRNSDINKMVEHGSDREAIVQLASDALNKTLASGGAQLTPAAIKAAVQETASLLGAVKAGAKPATDDIALGEFSSEYNPTEATPDASEKMPNINDRDAYEQAMLKRIIENTKASRGGTPA